MFVLEKENYIFLCITYSVSRLLGWSQPYKIAFWNIKQYEKNSKHTFGKYTIIEMYIPFCIDLKKNDSKVHAT